MTPRCQAARYSPGSVDRDVMEVGGHKDVFGVSRRRSGSCGDGEGLKNAVEMLVIRDMAYEGRGRGERAGTMFWVIQKRSQRVFFATQGPVVWQMGWDLTASARRRIRAL